MTPKLRKCATCRERAVSVTILPTYETTLNHDGRTYSLTLHDLPATLCGNCQTVVLEDEADESLSDALRARVGLLSPSQIHAKREGLGLTQAQLADLLRISPSTLSRWETGAQIQQRSMDVLLRGFFDVPAYRAYLTDWTRMLNNRGVTNRQDEESHANGQEVGVSGEARLQCGTQAVAVE